MSGLFPGLISADFRSACERAIPPYGLVKLAELIVPKDLNRTVWQAKEPLACDMDDLYVNGMVEIQPKGTGTAFQGPIQRAAYDPQDGTPKVGEPWGVKQGGYLLRRGYGGFVVVQQPKPEDKELAIVRRKVLHRYIGEITSNLEGPSDGWASPNTGTLRVFLPNPYNTDDPIDYYDTGDGVQSRTSVPGIDANAIDLTFVSRDPSLEALEGTLAAVEWRYGEWAVYWRSC